MTETYSLSLLICLDRPALKNELIPNDNFFVLYKQNRNNSILSYIVGVNCF